MLFLAIKGDSNDADYVTSVKAVTKEQLEQFKPLINEIRHFTEDKNEGKEYNFLTLPSHFNIKHADELYGHFKCFEDFLSYVPSSESYGIHTIIAITLINGKAEELM